MAIGRHVYNATMNYPAVIHKDSDYGVTFPDLPGCFSTGKTIKDAMELAQEAAELHLEGYLAEGISVPEPHGMDRYIDDESLYLKALQRRGSPLLKQFSIAKKTLAE